MRRALLFILLFGSGMALLVMFDRLNQEPENHMPAGRESPLDRALVDTQTVEVSGYTKMEFFDAETGLVFREFEASDLQPKGQGMVRPYLATGLTILEYIQGSGDLLRRVNAESADLVLDLGGGLGGPQLGGGSKIQLHQVRLEQLRDLPQAPLTVTAPEILAELDSQVYRANNEYQVKVVGEGLTAEGSGLFFDARAGHLEFPMGGTVDLLRTGIRRGVLSTAVGTPLVLKQQGGERGERFEITADGPSVLVLVQEQELQLDAEYLHVETRAGESGVEVSRIIARGPMVVTRGADRFGGIGATVQFESDGSVRFEVASKPWFSFGDGATADAPALVTMTGEGVLWAVDGPDELLFGLDGEGEFAGPGGSRLEAQDGFTGTLAGDRGSVDLDLRGEVFMGQEGLEVFTSNAHLLAMGGDELEVRLQTGEPLQIISNVGGEPTGSLTAVGGADLILEKGELQVIQALGVQAETFGGQEGSLSCDELKNLSADFLNFDAKGKVSWQTSDGSGFADRMVAKGDQIELFGLPGQKAQLAWRDEGTQIAELEAMRVVASATHLEAWDEVRVDLVLAPAQLGMGCAHTRIDQVGQDFHWRAEKVTDGLWTEGETVIALEAGTLEADWSRIEQEDGSFISQASLVQVQEDVRAHITQGNTVNVQADSLTMIPGQSVTLNALPGRQITARGLLPATGFPFTVHGTLMVVQQDEVRLQGVKGVLEGALLPLSPGAPKAADHLRENSDFAANLFVLTRTSLELEGEAYLESADLDGNPLTLTADRISSGYDLPPDRARPGPSNIHFINAEGNVRAAYGGLARFEADELLVDHERVILRGSPLLARSEGVRFETTEATFGLADYLLDAEAGIIRQGPAWSLAFSGAAGVRTGPDLMQTISGLVHVNFDETSRADYMSIWLHPSRWRAMIHERLWGMPLDLDFEGLIAESPDLQETDLVNNTFQRLARGELAAFVRAFHLWGSVEVASQGVRSARAEEAYLDLEGRRGWLKETELGFEIEVRGKKERLRAFAGRLDSLPSGGLVASDATLTACNHEIPHYVIETEDLRLEPRADGNWKFGVSGNRLRFPGGFGLPLPGIGSVVLDEAGSFEGFEDGDGKIRTIQNIFLSSTARFGTALGTEGATDIGSLGQGVATVFGFDKTKAKGQWKYEGAWLGSRGPLLGMGLLLRENESGPSQDDVYWLNLWARGIHDQGEDRGVLRVEDGTESDTRLWLNARGRYPFDSRQWIDAVVNYQTDPGVQSEFYEREYLDYEERDTYLHWRKARDGHYFSAKVSDQGNSFRSAVLERPAVGLYRGAAEVGRVLDHSLSYSASVDAAYLERHEGDLDFEPAFLGLDGNPDGLGDRRVMRVDTIHELALPVGLGESGVIAVPTLDLQATSWDRSVNDNQTVGRAGVFAGLEMGGSWARISNTSATSLSPFISHREELWIDEEVGQIVQFDSLDQPIGGSRSGVGLRLRWTRPVSNDRMDFDLGLERLHGNPQSAAQLDTARFLGSLGTTAFGIPVGIRHDGRYLFDEGETAYSKSVFAIKPVDWFEFQLVHDRGNQANLDTLYEAITYRGRITLDAKWEVDALAQHAIFGGGSLRSELLLRRIGHDFIFEVGIFHREGEGSGIKVDLAPLLGWTRPRVSILSPR